MIGRNLRLALISLILVPALYSVSAQQTSATDSWLDRSLVNWNRQGADLPRLPGPSAESDESEFVDRCREQVRKPASAAERAVVRRGWRLFGPVQSYAPTRVFSAMAGVDGMCRPMGYQVFVFSEGRYAGTLSPAAMDSRTDGSLSNVRLISSTRISAEFARYGASDALCCPSRMSMVDYNVRNDEIPDLTAVNVTTVAAGQKNDQSQGRNDSGASVLFGKRWVLTKIGEQRITAGKPYIEFAPQEKRVSGDSGCNRFSGGFEINGTSLKFSQLIGTRRACVGEEANRLETNFLQALERTTRFEVRNGTLSLYEGDSPLLVFTAE